jgi:hypothetical protein
VVSNPDSRIRAPQPFAALREVSCTKTLYTCQIEHSGIDFPISHDKDYISLGSTLDFGGPVNNQKVKTRRSQDKTETHNSKIPNRINFIIGNTLMTSSENSGSKNSEV